MNRTCKLQVTCKLQAHSYHFCRGPIHKSRRKRFSGVDFMNQFRPQTFSGIFFKWLKYGLNFIQNFVHSNKSFRQTETQVVDLVSLKSHKIQYFRCGTCKVFWVNYGRKCFIKSTPGRRPDRMLLHHFDGSVTSQTETHFTLTQLNCMNVKRSVRLPLSNVFDAASDCRKRIWGGG
jgi:hypothetical protein